MQASTGHDKKGLKNWPIAYETKYENIRSMNKDNLGLSTTIIQEYRDWLDELGTLSYYIAKWAIRYGSKGSTSQPKFLEFMRSIEAEANHMHSLIPIWKLKLHSKSSLEDLMTILDEVRTSAIAIHTYVNLSAGGADKVAKYDEILFILTQEAEPHFHALGKKLGE